MPYLRTLSVLTQFIKSSTPNMLSQINSVFIFILVAIDLATRLVIGTLKFILLVCKALYSLDKKAKALTPLNNTVFFNSINYPDELNCDLN